MSQYQKTSEANANQAGGDVSEAQYELPGFTETVEIIIKNQKRSIQDTLEALASQGYYVVRKRK